MTSPPVDPAPVDPAPVDPAPVDVVTGAGSGMGRACLRRFAGAGPLVAVDLDADALGTLVDELTDAGLAVARVVGDITDPDTVRQVADVVAARGRLGRLVHAAGLSPTMGLWHQVLSVNLVGTVRVLDAVEPFVTSGSVAVLIASQAGHFVPAPPPELAEALADPLADDFLDAAAAAGIEEPGGAYAWSKWAVRRLAVERAPAWGALGGRIVSLSPGIIATPMGRKEMAEQPMMAGMIDVSPIRRMGTADEIAAAVDFLCSPAASFVTGTDLLVDGGSTEQVRGQLGVG